MDCSIAFNAMKRINLLKALASFLVKRYAGTPAEVFYNVKIRERRTMFSGTGGHQGDGFGPALFFMRLGTRLAKLR